jgi:hypothetical protein
MPLYEHNSRTIASTSKGKSAVLGTRRLAVLVLALAALVVPAAGQADPPPVPVPVPPPVGTPLPPFVLPRLVGCGSSVHTLNLNYATIAAALAAASPGGTILICPGTYGGGFTISKNVTLRGSGGTPTISGGGTLPVVTVSAGVSVTIDNVTITGGNSFAGGGIFNRGTLTLDHSFVTGNHSTNICAGAGLGGGGIYNGGTLTLKYSVVSGNDAHCDGAGIDNYGTLTLDNSSVDSNSSTAASSFNTTSGGGIHNKGMLTLDNSHVDYNYAAWSGGGIFNEPGATTKLRTSSTVNQNTAFSSGGIGNAGTLTYDATVTVSSNSFPQCSGVTVTANVCQ